MWNVFEHFNCSTDFDLEYSYLDRGQKDQNPNESYADISGPGVVSAFFGIGFLVTFLCIVDYFVACGLSTETRAGGINRADEAIARPVQRALRYIFPSLREQSRVDRIHKILQASMLELSETQAYTGFAILLSGFIILFTDELSEFHWETIGLLGWMCHNTNLTAMTSLRFVVKSEPTIRRWWRLGLMAALAGMLVIALFQAPFRNNAWRSNGGLYAICAYNNDRISTVFQSRGRVPEVVSMLLGIGLVLLTFFARVAKLSEPLLSLTAACGRYCGELSQRMIARLDTRIAAVESKTGRAYLRYGIRPWLIGSMHFTVHYWDFLGSTLSEVLALIFCLWWLSMRMWMQLSNTHPEERRWTFGQILPLALLIYPAVSLVFGRSTETRKAASVDYSSENPGNTISGTQSSTSVTDTSPSYNLGYLQTYDWFRLVVYQDFIQLALIASDIISSGTENGKTLLTRGVYMIEFLVAHFFSLYLAMVINTLAEDALKSRYPQESPSRRQAAGVMHFSICSGISLGVFGFTQWSYQFLGGWPVPWESRVPFLYYGGANVQFQFDYKLEKMFVLILGIAILFHVLCLSFSIWLVRRCTSDDGEEDIEI